MLQKLPETAKEQDGYDALNSRLESCELTWQNCVGICTDGAPAMTGNVKGLVSLAQQQNPNTMITRIIFFDLKKCIFDFILAKF